MRMPYENEVIVKISNLIILFLTVMAMVSCGENDKSSTTRKNQIITLVAKPFSTKLFFSGIVQPLKTVVITSPADGVIQEMQFHYGDNVASGKQLFTISSEKFQTEYKNTLMQYIKAKNEFNTSQGQLKQSEFLHKNELISDDEFRTKQSSFYNAQLALVQAKDTLNQMLKQLSVPGLNIEELTIANIDKITQALHAQGDSQKLHVMANTSGVALLPTKADGESDSKKIGKGDQVKQGDVLAVIGDTSGLTIRVNVNEFNINQIKIGQKVSVTGAAFSDLVLQGEIAGIDRQAQSSSAGMPMFPVEIIVPKLAHQEQKIIHIGMSAKVEINIESEPQITVPIAAVFEKKGQTFVNAKDPQTGKIQEIPVKTGQTTAEAVVIESKLKIGDKIVISG